MVQTDVSGAPALSNDTWTSQKAQVEAPLFSFLTPWLKGTIFIFNI